MKLKKELYDFAVKDFLQSLTLTKLLVNLSVEGVAVKATAEFLINVNAMQDTLATTAPNAVLMISGVRSAAMSANVITTRFVTIDLEYAIVLLDGPVTCKDCENCRKNYCFIIFRCQYPCPKGTHGQMCRKLCECDECNPVNGKCLNYPSKNVTNSVIESLNSTIANITQNLDIIAKNLKHPNEKYTEDPDSTTESNSNVHHELIFIKPENENPSIILHHPKLNSRDFGTKAPEVIHVITNLQQRFKIANDTSVESEKTVEKAHVVTIVLIVAIVIFVVVIVVSLFFYRKHMKKNSVSPSSSNHVHENKTYVNGKPLPELPGFTTILSRIPEGSDLYDAPRNNALVKGPYSYARKESMYSVCIPKSRKGSLESHLYDEIRYPSVSQKV